MVTRGEQRGADVDIEGADILIAGGRGLGKAEGFELAEELAKAFGGNSAVAATRAVVDAGWYPYAAQIGQTGKTVSPKLYLAAGISGAIQHKVGMQSSENIVAINKDANAPIFEFSDLGDRRRPQQDPAEADRGCEGQEGQLSDVRHDGAQQREGRAGGLPAAGRLAKEFIKRGLDAEDELIEVGVAIVGGGTAGLACANRLLQLLADDPETMERLGEVPVAVVEKAKTCGGHNLSGAVMRPEPLEELFPDMTREQWREEGFAFGEVKKESVYMLTGPKTKLPVPIPAVPNFKNHGNEVVSVSALARFQQRQAEEAGAYVLTETSATQLIVEDGARGRRALRATRAAARTASRSATSSRGPTSRRSATVLAEGCWGHLTGAAIKEFDLAEGREPQVWELGVKEVWKVPKPLDRVIHTFVQPWPLKVSAKYGQLGGTWIYPMKDEKTGEDLVSIGFVVDLNYRDATTSAHDLLQTFKTHPLVKGILEGGERVAWGAKALPGGGYWSMPKLSMPGAVIVGDAGGMVDTAALKGVHHCIKSGMLAAESIYAALKRGSSDLVRLRGGGREVHDRQPSSTRCATRGRRSRKASSSAARWRVRRSCRRARSRRAARSGTATTPSRCSSARPRTATPSPTANTPSTSSPRCSSPATPRATTRRTTSACRNTSHARSPRPGGGCARRVSMRSPRTRPRRARST